MVVRFSKSNECRILARTRVEITENRAKQAEKTLRLDGGRSEVKLDPGFREHNRFDIETPTAVCAALGSAFFVEAAVVADMSTTEVGMEQGKVRLLHRCFLIPLLEAGDTALLALSADRAFGRLTVRDGEYELHLQDTGGEGIIQKLTLIKDTIVECDCEESVDGSKLIITVRVLRPGQEQPDMYRIERELGDRGPHFLDPEKKKTTTTTIPSVTPVGEQ